MKYILSCDGGGTRGIVSLGFLLKLEEEIGPLYDVFDLFVGTSTGSIIAFLIGVKKLKVKEIIELYSRENLKKIFDKSLADSYLDVCQTYPKYDGKGKTLIMQSYGGNSKLSEGKPILVPTYDVRNRKLKFFKSWSDGSVRGSDIIDAATAAPAFFPSVKIGDLELIDGGVVVNNPALCAYSDAIKMWPNEKIKILSVGTGNCGKPLSTHGWGGIQWISGGLIDVLTDQSHVDYQMSTMIGENYLRINSKLCNFNEELDNTGSDHLTKLKELGFEWWRSNKTLCQKFFGDF